MLPRAGSITTIALIGEALLVASVTPAPAKSFYIVQDAITRQCSVVDKKPTIIQKTIIGFGRVYLARQEAEATMKTLAVCRSLVSLR